MPRFRTPRERRLWLIAAGVVLLIYAAAYFVQFLLDALRTRGLLAAAVWGAVIVAAAAGAAFVVRDRPGRWEVALLFAAAGVYLLLLRHLHILQERIHLIEYGTVGGLTYAALCERWAAPNARTDDTATTVERPRWQRWPAAWAIVIATLAGWGDELVQALLPNRHYDLRDVATNAEAAALLVIVLAARRRLRASPTQRALPAPTRAADQART
jgi:drug/metabolite transporter (DMT)-like permease